LSDDDVPTSIKRLRSEEAEDLLGGGTWAPLADDLAIGEMVLRVRALLEGTLSGV
jgi:hypothetical protein